MDMKRFIASMALFEALLVAVHLAVYRTAEAAFGTPPAPWDTVLAWGFVALAFTYLASSVISRRSFGPFAQAFYKFASYWFGLVSFLFAGAFLFFVAVSVLYPLNVYIDPALLGGIAFGFAFLLHCYATWQSGRAEPVSVTVAMKGLPESWKERKIAFISDVHLGQVRGRRFAAKVARKVREAGVHALFIGGDLYDGPACDVEGVIAPLAPLAQELPGGTWFITGNHEYFLPDLAAALEAVKKAGMKLLDNRKEDLDGVQIIGVDDKDVHGEGAFRTVIDRIPFDRARPSILLKHIPSDIDVAAEKGISLELCGHTHNGQIYPFQWIVKKIFYGYGYGHHPYGDMDIYTSSGVGTWGPPMRFGTRSEIVVITFRS